MPWIIVKDGYQEVGWGDAEDYEVFPDLKSAIEADERREKENA